MANLTWYAYKSGEQYTTITVDYTENIYPTYSTITINDISCFSTYIYASESYYWTGLKLQVQWGSTTQTIIDGMYFPMAGGSSNANALAVTTTSQIPTGSAISFILSGTLWFHGDISRENLTIGSSTGSSATTQAISTHTHTWNSGVVTAPTCTTQGYTTYTCSSCGSSYKDAYTAALGHSFSNNKCTVCGISLYMQQKYKCCIDNGTSFVKYNAYIDNGSSWNKNFITIEVPRS